VLGCETEKLYSTLLDPAKSDVDVNVEYHLPEPAWTDAIERIGRPWSFYTVNDEYISPVRRKRKAVRSKEDNGRFGQEQIDRSIDEAGACRAD